MGSVMPGYGFFPAEIWVFFYVAEGVICVWQFNRLSACSLLCCIQ